MILREVKAEWLKEIRSANQKLLLLVPFIFVLFSFLMTLLMGEGPEGQSYIVAAGFNWYPIMILPVILTLLATNIYIKEKLANQVFFRSLGLNVKNQVIAKNIVVLLELLIILLLSSFFILIIGIFVLKDTISVSTIILATLCLFIGSLPIVGFSFIAHRFVHRVIVILVNFVLTIFSAIVAIEAIWWTFPWSYNLRMLAPILGIHPNGTFLSPNDSLMDGKVIGLGIILSILVYISTVFIQLNMERRKRNV